MNLKKPILNISGPTSELVDEQRINREDTFKSEQKLEENQFDSPVINRQLKKPDMKFATQKK